jgi:hypothetical protein
MKVVFEALVRGYKGLGGLVYATPSAIYKGIGVFYGFDTVFAASVVVIA